MKSPTMNPSQPLNHTQIEILLADYRDLRGAERAAVDEHLRTCAACTARLADYQVMDRDLVDLRDARPDARLRTGYLAAVQPGNLQPANLQRATARRLSLLPGLAGAVAVLALVAGVLFVLRPGEPPRRGGGLPLSPTASSPAAAPTTDVRETPVPTPTAIAPEPTATPGPVVITTTVDAPRDPETTQVTLDIYSGLPNPVWTLTAAQTQEMRQLLDGLPEAACEPVNLNLGLRGFVVELGQRPELSNEYRLRVAGRQVRWGDPWTPDGATLCYSDAERAVARFLLASGQAHMPEGVHALVEQDIEQADAVPSDWLAYSDETFGFSFAHPSNWEGPQDTAQSRLFYAKQDEPAGPAFPVFYVTVIPAGFANESAEAYNFWSTEEVAAARALEVGASGPIHGAEGYNIYTRLSDVTTVAGLTGAVVESERVWEGGPDTRDRRVLLTHEGTLYMLGTYYTTPEELRVFEQVVGTFRMGIEAALVQAILFSAPNQVCEWQELGRQGNEVYVWVYCLGRLPGQQKTGRSLPAVLVLDTNGAVQDVRTPGEGIQYADDVRALFPPEVQRQIFGSVSQIVTELQRRAEQRLSDSVGLAAPSQFSDTQVSDDGYIAIARAHPDAQAFLNKYPDAQNDVDRSSKLAVDFRVDRRPMTGTTQLWEGIRLRVFIDPQTNAPTETFIQCDSNMITSDLEAYLEQYVASQTCP